MVGTWNVGEEGKEKSKGCNGVNGGIPKRYVHILTLEPKNVTLFRKGIFADVIELRILR
jgi:hypothetical protein